MKRNFSIDNPVTTTENPEEVAQQAEHIGFQYVEELLTMECMQAQEIIEHKIASATDVTALRHVLYLLNALEISEIDNEKISQLNTMDFRERILEKSHGKLMTCETFTKGFYFSSGIYFTADGVFKREYKTKICDDLDASDTWVKERADDQEKMITDQLERIKLLSHEIYIAEVLDGYHGSSPDVIINFLKERQASSSSIGETLDAWRLKM